MLTGRNTHLHGSPNFYLSSRFQRRDSHDSIHLLHDVQAVAPHFCEVLGGRPNSSLHSLVVGLKDTTKERR